MHIDVLISRPDFPFLVLLGVTPSSLSNDIREFDISFVIILVQKSVPDFLQIMNVSFTVLGTHIPKLCYVR